METRHKLRVWTRQNGLQASDVMQKESTGVLPACEGTVKVMHCYSFPFHSSSPTLIFTSSCRPNLALKDLFSSLRYALVNRQDFPKVAKEPI